MSVLVRDTLSGREVEVGKDGKVGLYVCGPTVYNHIHIGNARAPLFWDVVARYLRSRGYEVTLVQNITDIDDKIIVRANEEGVSWEEIVRRYTDSFHELLALLGVDLPDVEPRATEHIPEMISLIQELIDKDHAYAPGNGDVYYRVESYPLYGQLSKQRPEEMRETEKGAGGYKESPLDFALWKASKPGEPSWESPWGPGRPGWHIECSAMVEKHLPDGADIHGGGTDLRFPHHENELAQSAGAHPEHTFVRAWAHHGMVNIAIEGQISNKMAKSLGNVLDVERAIDMHGGRKPYGGKNALRMWLLQSHYSQPIDYSEEILEEKNRAYWRLQNLYANIIHSTSSSELSKRLTTRLRERFDLAMKDNLNTPEALSALFEVAKEASREISARPEARQEFAELKEAFDELMGTILGFELGRAQTTFVEPLTSAVEVGQATIVNVRWRLGPEQEEPGQETRDKVSLREKARSEKDWSLADRLRDELHAEGWAIEDTPEGPIVSRR